jgi:hypothetical protein
MTARVRVREFVLPLMQQAGPAASAALPTLAVKSRYVCTVHIYTQNDDMVQLRT